MFSSFQAWAGPIGLASLMLACGASSSVPDPSGAGGSTATAGSGATGSSVTATGPGTTTVGAGGGSGGAAGVGGAGGGAGDAEGSSLSSKAIALFNSELPAALNRSGWLLPGEELRPNTLIVAISTQPLACVAPSLNYRTANSETLVLVGLPEAMQKPGTYALSSTDVIAWGRTWVGDGQGNGGGTPTGIPLQEGTVEVVNIGAGSIDIRFAGLEREFGYTDGPHTAVRCP
jgi:hypothetical protein